MAANRGSGEVTLLMRRFALERCGYRCEACLAVAPVAHPVWCGLDVNHRVSWQEGIESAGNLSVLCLPCHQDFHRRRLPYETWIAGVDVDREGQTAYYIPRGQGRERRRLAQQEPPNA